MQLRTSIVGAGPLEHCSVWLFPSYQDDFVPEDVNSLIIQLTYCYQTHITGIILSQQIDILCSKLDICALTWQKQQQQQQQIDLLPDSHLSVTQTGLLCYNDRVPAPCGQFLRPDLLNDVSWHFPRSRRASSRSFTARTVVFLSALLFIQTQPNGGDNQRA